MAIQEQDRGKPAGPDLVYALLQRLQSTDGTTVHPDTDLASIGFDSLACAEFAAAVEREMGIDLVDRKLASLRTASEVADIVERTGATDRRRRESYPRGMGRVQQPAKAIAGPLCRWWFSMDVKGLEHVPRSGPVVLCMNHESFLDIPLMVVASPRPIRYMAKRELFEKPALARFFHLLGGFSVERSAFDLRAMEIALEIIRRGEVLGMYPEGTRTPGVLLPFLPGAAWIALKTGAPLLPAALSGTGAAMPTGAKFFKRVPIRIDFAPAVPVERVDDPLERLARARELTPQLRDTIEGMWIP
jgi:1-acyl-sn-glycerol-3-phosphate acyltransferase